MKIAASFLSCKKIEPAIKKLNVTDVDYIHVDVIDNKFVKGRKISFRKLKKLYRLTSKRLDVHLMVEKPKKYIKKFATLNTERIVFHVELGKNIESNLKYIRNLGIKNGLVINPDTEITVLKPYLDQIDTILVMSVMPGYGGQDFQEEAIDRLKKIKKMIGKRKIELSIDGGIKEEQAKKLKDADIIVSGSYITNYDNYQEQINKLRESPQK